MAVGFEAFEAFLRIVQHRGARVELERRIRFDAAVGPALALRPGHVRHAVGEDLPECGLVDQFLALGVRCRVLIGQHGEAFRE